ncbi:MAG TPA: hypothetical protein VNV25_25310 [Gemmatimonadaceae bacterium]|nr:hypothetical protein [Gemmatimonadaceae bacterium]
MRTPEERTIKDWDVEGNGNPVHTHVCECCKESFDCDCNDERMAALGYTMVGCVACAGCGADGCTKAAT